MLNVAINTEDIRYKVDDILALTSEYEMLLEKMFKELLAIEENGWSGQSAHLFFNQVMCSKPKYKSLINTVNLYAKSYNSLSETYDKFIGKWDMK